MTKDFFVLVLAALPLAACATPSPPSSDGTTHAGAPSPGREELPILVSNPAEAAANSGKVVHLYGRSISSTFQGWSTPALELPTGGIVVLEPKSGATTSDVLHALKARPMGGRFLAIGKIQMLPSKESQREFATLTLETLPLTAVAATADEIIVGLWPASTPTAISVAPIVQVPLSGTRYEWWSLYRNGEGALFLESDAFGRSPIELEEPIEMVNELMALDADGDSLFELVLLLTAKSGKKRAIVVGIGGRRNAALEAKLGLATTVDEISKALGTHNWQPILSGSNGVNLARVLWDEGSLGKVPLVNLRLSGMRFYTAEELIMKDEPRSAQASLRIRAENGQAIVDVRCGIAWKTADRRDVPANRLMLPSALRALREFVDQKGTSVNQVCTP